MMIGCPVCGARYTLDAAAADSDGREALALIAGFGDLAPGVVAYLGLFRGKGRVTTWRRLRRLLQELTAAVESGRVKRRRRTWDAPRAAWAEAMRIAVERRDAGQLDLPLRDHAYLYEVVAGLAGRAEADAERATEDARRNRAGGRTGGPARIGDVAAGRSGRRSAGTPALPSYHWVERVAAAAQKHGLFDVLADTAELERRLRAAGVEIGAEGEDGDG